MGGRILSHTGFWDLSEVRPLPLNPPPAHSDTLLIASPLLTLAAPWPLTICAGFSPLQLPHVVIAVCCPCRCLTLEGTARRSAAAEAAITSATEVANTRDGGRGRDRAAASVTVGTVGKTVTTFDPGGESAKTRRDLKPCGVSPAWLEAAVVSPASGWPGPCSLMCSEL